MPQLNPIDISTLPKQAQIELYDFYLFLKQCYQTKETAQQHLTDDKVRKPLPFKELAEFRAQQTLN